MKILSACDSEGKKESKAVTDWKFLFFLCSINVSLVLTVGLQ